MEPSSSRNQAFTAGQDVEVRQRFTAGWSRGFQVDEVDMTGPDPQIWLRRRSDGARLPRRFTLDDVRQA